MCSVVCLCTCDRRDRDRRARRRRVAPGTRGSTQRDAAISQLEPPLPARLPSSRGVHPMNPQTPRTRRCNHALHRPRPVAVCKTPEHQVVLHSYRVNTAYSVTSSNIGCENIAKLPVCDVVLKSVHRFWIFGQILYGKSVVSS